jgi:nucleoid-associated protein YgaU
MRYKNQRVFINDSEAYIRYLKGRGLKQIKQYSTPKMFYPRDVNSAANFDTLKHIWGTGDKYFKLADEYYQDPTMWWVIAFYNQKPTEFHIKLGDVIFIPVPLESILYSIGY